MRNGTRSFGEGRGEVSAEQVGVALAATLSRWAGNKVFALNAYYLFLEEADETLTGQTQTTSHPCSCAPVRHRG